MNKDKGQEMTPLLSWSNERIQEWWRQVFQPDISPHIQREGALHLMERIRNDYEVKIAELERALGEATELDSPDGEGYWEFTGRIEGSSVDKVQWLVMVRFAKLDKQYYAYRFGGMTIRANLMIGAWKRIYTSWDRRTSSSPTVAPDADRQRLTARIDQLENALGKRIKDKASEG